MLRTLGTSLHLEINITCPLKLGGGGRTVTHHKPHVPKIQNDDIQPFAEDVTFVPKTVGVKSNLIFLHI